MGELSDQQCSRRWHGLCLDKAPTRQQGSPLGSVRLPQPPLLVAPVDLPRPRLLHSVPTVDDSGMVRIAHEQRDESVDHVCELVQAVGHVEQLERETLQATAFGKDLTQHLDVQQDRPTPPLLDASNMMRWFGKRR